MLPRRVSQETDLLSVAATPSAKEQVQAQAESLAKRELAVERVRLQAGRLLAVW